MSNETRIPQNHVVGVIGGQHKAEDIASRLRAEGYDDVLVMDRVEATGEGTNPISALIEKLAGHLSDQTAYLDQYKEATEGGNIVVAVGTDPDSAPRARDLLEQAGAVNVRFFGRLAVTDMSPDTNPSAASNEPPRGPHGPENG